MHSEIAPYLRIVATIERRIAGGDLAPGAKVPSTRQITRDWGVATATATKVLGELRARGLVHAVPGVGTVVSAAPAAPVRVRRRAAAEDDDVRARLVAAAIAIADDEGIDSVSMRRIAVDVGLPTMSVYRYVAGKEELLTAMLNATLGASDWPDPPPPGWRAPLEYVARRQWAGYREHPWLARVVSLSRPQLAPDAMMHTEWTLRALTRLSVGPAEILTATLSLFGFVQGIAANLDGEAQAQRDTGIDSEEWMRRQDFRFTPVIESGRYPHLEKIDGNVDLDASLDAVFEFGLARLLDGYAAHFDRRAPPAEGR